MRHAALALGVLAASPALAESFACSWRSECFGSYGCEDTSYDTTLASGDGGWTFSGVAGDAAVWEVTPPGDAPARLFLVPPGGDDASATLLSIGDDGSSAFTQHGSLDGVSVVTYFGTCEAR